jgi:dTDP-4-dehydrorhamnose 3,5-epimerase
MTVTPTLLKDCFILEPKVFYDERGYFMESFNEKTFHEKTGIATHFVQDNQSVSTKGVLRGLHYQIGEFAQAKLVQVLQGEVLDVVVDIRPESATFGKYEAVLLTAENKKQLYIPRGFAHGFLVLSDSALFSYKCDNFYHKESESGIAFDDPSIGIDWNFPKDKMIISEKDQNNPTLANAKKIW